jgi:predicted GH43/DUF377 family glycosyl hydrolase
MSTPENAALNHKYHHFYQLFETMGLLDDKSRLLRDKDVVLFPRKINGNFALLHRIWPGIQIAYFKEWEELTSSYWDIHLKNLPKHIVLDPKGPFDINYIGAGGPPIETQDGWLLIYHGIQETASGRTYHAMAALLHLENPEIEIARLSYPLFSPTRDWEKDVGGNGIVFPTGHALKGNDLYVFYGAGDLYVAAAKMKLDEILTELKKEP